LSEVEGGHLADFGGDEEEELEAV
jgi:hypothetical protein